MREWVQHGNGMTKFWTKIGSGKYANLQDETMIFHAPLAYHKDSNVSNVYGH